MICEPQPKPIFFLIDTGCIAVFTLDYLVRICTCGFVPPRISGIVPKEWFDWARHQASFHNEKPLTDPPWHFGYRVLKYFLQPINMIDFASIIPYYATLTGQHSQTASFLRAVRLVRILRILKLIKIGTSAHTADRTLKKVVVESMEALIILMVFVCLIVIVAGCIMQNLEGGTFEVEMKGNTTVPGHYRPDLTNTYPELSPYWDVRVGMYWAVQTCATLGYGQYLSILCRIMSYLILSYHMN